MPKSNSSTAGGRSTSVAKILQQARTSIQVAATANGQIPSAGSPGGRGGAAAHRSPHRRHGTAAVSGRDTDQMALSAELGIAAPIGPAVIELLKLAYKANVPPLLIGAHGLGKSEIARAAAAAIGIDCITRDLSLMEPPDLVGLPKIEGNVTSFLPPDFLPRETGRGGFLLIEEINRAPRYMQACCLELLTSRRLNSYSLPAGWLPLACLNPKSEGYAVDLLDQALMSRFMQITVCADVEAWATWARGSGIHPKVLEYVTSVPNSLDESQGGSNPRSWEFASRTLHAAGPELLERSPDTIVTALNGLIGPVHTTALLRMVYGTEVALKPADVLRDPQGAKATVRRWAQQGRLDLLTASMRAMLQWVRPDGIAARLRVDIRQRGAVRGFIKQLPGDLQEQARACLLELGHTHLIPSGDVVTGRNSGRGPVNRFASDGQPASPGTP